VRDAILAKHREWLGDLSDKDVLDLGCNSGNSLSVEMASSSRSYLGIDLSAPAIEQLRDTLRNIPNARVEAIDFLAADYRQRFDVIYAHSVLHHFEDFDLICAELRRALRPGGAVISLDPLQTDPVNKMIRLLYRPFQADRNWEWPFTIRNFEIIRRHFIIEAIQGFRGASRAGLVAGSAAARGGLAWDLQHANKAGLPLLLCWMVAMKFCKRPSD
jgi:SAM-dependent methyltransferase